MIYAAILLFGSWRGMAGRSKNVEEWLEENAAKGTLLQRPR